MSGFSSLGLADWLVQQCRHMGILRPTPVQEHCLPPILEGRDCLGCAKTGSGKTAAFVLPVVQKLSEDPYGIFCLVLTPTRELAYQIAEQFRVIGKPLGLRDCIVTLLFSATLTDTLQELQGITTNKPFFWESKSETRTVDELDQRYILTPEKIKDAYLVHLVQTFTDQHSDWSIIIFTKTCKDCQILTMMLREFNFPTISLHSMMKQKVRFANLSKFKASVYKILIATDVASRGLDIPTVQVVINHNTPGLPKIYIHRVGRTARAGRHGVSITMVTQYDIHLVHAIEEQTQSKLKEYEVAEKDVLRILTQVNVARRECEIDPEMEAKRKAELEKIRKQKKLFKQRVEESVQQQRAEQRGRSLLKKKRRLEQKKKKLEAK
ncbi:hypothetical protein CRUP_034988 [Coryphaenoides rupestris]|nr:hypothetical protein CRUP_034988 [Coryphaenoides rupestris]